MNSDYIIELYDNKQHENRDFTCGLEPLDTYLKTRASQEIRKKIAVVYIIRKNTTSKVIGFYTLSSSSIDLINLSEKQARKLPKYKAIPVTLLGRLAVDMQYQGKKVGEYLLLDCLNRSYNLSKQIGCFAVIVEAKDEKSRNYYEKYGFIRSVSQPFKLYLPMSTIKELINE